MPPASHQTAALIRLARQGDEEALGRLLEHYRHYLTLIARLQEGKQLQVRVAPSDLAQETMVAACQKFGQSAGASGKELVAWLRRILVRKLSDEARQNQAGVRDVRRDRSLEAFFDQSSQAADAILAGAFPSPSEQAVEREQAVLLANSLAELPKDHREVIVLRHLERRPFSEIAETLGRSEGAVRQLWLRVMERLRAKARHAT